MSTYIKANRTLWPRKARPQGAMPAAIVAGLCVGIIAGISTSGVLTEFQVKAPAQAVVQAQAATENPITAAALVSTSPIIAASPTASQVAKEVPNVSTSVATESADNAGPSAATDGRGGETPIDRGAVAMAPVSAPAAVSPVASAPVATAPVASAPVVSAPAANVPSAEKAEAAAAAPPAVEPTAAPANRPSRVVRKRQKQPTNYSSRGPEFPFFPLFGRGGLFSGSRG